MSGVLTFDAAAEVDARAGRRGGCVGGRERPGQATLAWLGERRPTEAGGGPTLDDLVVGTWNELTVHRAVSCLVCGATMTPRYGSGASPVGGRCEGCGTTLG